MSLEVSRSCEMEFFENHNYFRLFARNTPSLFGVESLTHKLTEILKNHIVDSLPDIAAELNATIDGTYKSLAKLHVHVREAKKGKPACTGVCVCVCVYACARAYTST